MRADAVDMELPVCHQACSRSQRRRRPRSAAVAVARPLQIPPARPVQPGPQPEDRPPSPPSPSPPSPASPPPRAAFAGPPQPGETRRSCRKHAFVYDALHIRNQRFRWLVIYYPYTID
eukprot:scaffold7276_cov34-Phaeocystis_antarctica.AAC.2